MIRIQIYRGTPPALVEAVKFIKNAAGSCTEITNYELQITQHHKRKRYEISIKEKN